MGRNVEVIVSFGGLHEKHAVQRGVFNLCVRERERRPLGVVVIDTTVWRGV
jgi:hypothetical protein